VPRPERGQTPAGFREQLLQRIRNDAARQRIDPRRLQQRVAFERLLARLAGTDDWMLKGGFALQLRYGLLARPTRDVDLRTMLPPAQALEAVAPRQGVLERVVEARGRGELDQRALEVAAPFDEVEPPRPPRARQRRRPPVGRRGAPASAALGRTPSAYQTSRPAAAGARPPIRCRLGARAARDRSAPAPERAGVPGVACPTTARLATKRNAQRLTPGRFDTIVV
jgi:hypothetical protein